MIPWWLWILPGLGGAYMLGISGVIGETQVKIDWKESKSTPPMRIPETLEELRAQNARHYSLLRRAFIITVVLLAALGSAQALTA